MPQEEKDSNNEEWEIIHAYTREDALSDGML